MFAERVPSVYVRNEFGVRFVAPNGKSRISFSTKDAYRGRGEVFLTESRAYVRVFLRMSSPRAALNETPMDPESARDPSSRAVNVYRNVTQRR